MPVEPPSEPVAGPSRHAQSYVEIPSYGPQFFEYRRRLFLANLPLPTPSPSTSSADDGNGTSPSSSLYSTYRIPLPLPDPLPLAPNAPAPSSSAGRLEAMLADEGAEETQAVWTGGLERVHAKLVSGRSLIRPLRLGIVIKVLKAGWIKDGTWPVDPETNRATRPPDSPFLGPIPPLRTTSMLPDFGLRADDIGLDKGLDQGAEIADDGDLHIGGDVWRGAKDAVPIPPAT